MPPRRFRRESESGNAPLLPTRLSGQAPGPGTPGDPTASTRSPTRHRSPRRKSWVIVCAFDDLGTDAGDLRQVIAVADLVQLLLLRSSRDAREVVGVRRLRRSMSRRAGSESGACASAFTTAAGPVRRRGDRGRTSRDRRTRRARALSSRRRSRRSNACSAAGSMPSAVIRRRASSLYGAGLSISIVPPCPRAAVRRR